jgi:hypothetical protein
MPATSMASTAPSTVGVSAVRNGTTCHPGQPWIAPRSRAFADAPTRYPARRADVSSESVRCSVTPLMESGSGRTGDGLRDPSARTDVPNEGLLRWAIGLTTGR